MKRMTIALEDEVYLSLVDLAANEARRDISRLSVSRTLQKIMQQKLGELNYYPPKRLERVPPLLLARGRLPVRPNSDSSFMRPAFEDADSLV